MSISNLRDVPSSLLLFSRIKDFMSDSYEIKEEEETKEEIKRVSKSKY